MPAQPLLISTIPRSGTWYTRYTLHVLHKLLAGEKHVSVPELYPEVARSGVLDYGATLNASPVFIDHFCYPYVEKLGLPEAWHTLAATPGMKDFMVQAEAMLTSHRLSRQGGGKIGFIYRNPFEHYLSLCQHLVRREPRKPRSWIHRALLAKEGLPPEEPADWNAILAPARFQQSALMDVYLFFLAPFVYLMRQYPERVLFLSFDQLTHRPEQAFAQLLQLLGHDLSDPRLQSCLQEAIALTSKENMRQYEKQLGHSLGKPLSEPVPQAGEIATHMHTSERQHWSQLFTDADRQYFLARLQELGITPEEVGEDIAEALSMGKVSATA